MSQNIWYEVVFVHEEGVIQTLDITKTLQEAIKQKKYFEKIYSTVRIIKSIVEKHVIRDKQVE